PKASDRLLRARNVDGKQPWRIDARIDAPQPVLVTPHVGCAAVPWQMDTRPVSPSTRTIQRDRAATHRRDIASLRGSYAGTPCTIRAFDLDRVGRGPKVARRLYEIIPRVD